MPAAPATPPDRRRRADPPRGAPSSVLVAPWSPDSRRVLGLVERGRPRAAARRHDHLGRRPRRRVRDLDGTRPTPRPARRPRPRPRWSPPGPYTLHEPPRREGSRAARGPAPRLRRERRVPGGVPEARAGDRRAGDAPRDPSTARSNALQQAVLERDRRLLRRAAHRRGRLRLPARRDRRRRRAPRRRPEAASTSSGTATAASCRTGWRATTPTSSPRSSASRPRPGPTRRSAGRARASRCSRSTGPPTELITYDGGAITGTPYPGAEQTVTTWAALRRVPPPPRRPGAGTARDRGRPAARRPSPRTRQGCRGNGHAELWTQPDGVHIPSLDPTFATQVVTYLLAHPKH